MYITDEIYIIGLVIIAILFGLIEYFGGEEWSFSDVGVTLVTIFAISWPIALPVSVIIGLFFLIHYLCGGRDGGE